MPFGSDDLYKLKLSGNVLCVSMRGVWPKTLINTIFEQTRALVKDIRHEPWAALVDMREWIMPTMEGQESFQAIYDWCAANNQTHEATVCSFDLQKRIVSESTSYDANTQVYTRTVEEAARWLVDKGFTFSPKDHAVLLGQADTSSQ
ncbi:hypothetical protein LJ739_11175 [Aestuariibacter halophilus]|uniref:Uncharacterized protein n=1 Tax=Fluctibacter halophilus TaxID=226011 RepID=A0ABS8G8P5_9ALTE|nr:hypothetical protein [Aestuariibacter halophilus]MCC2616803.1 hypothetical protein [Aestuariibacter halophilus]